jgi:hypothetical protein
LGKTVNPDFAGGGSFIQIANTGLSPTSLAIARGWL